MAGVRASRGKHTIRPDLRLRTVAAGHESDSIAREAMKWAVISRAWRQFEESHGSVNQFSGSCAVEVPAMLCSIFGSVVRAVPAAASEHDGGRFQANFGRHA